MRISDWSSDVCSSDLLAPLARPLRATMKPSESMLMSASRISPLRSRPSTDPLRFSAPICTPFCRNGASQPCGRRRWKSRLKLPFHFRGSTIGPRSEEHTSELQSLMRLSYAVFCLKKKNTEDRELEQKNNTD